MEDPNMARRDSFKCYVTGVFIFLVFMTFTNLLYLRTRLPAQPDHSLAKEDYLVNTKSCKLPLTSIEAPKVNSAPPVPNPSCAGLEERLVEIDRKAQILQLRSNYSKAACCFHEFKGETDFRLSPCQKFEETVKVDQSQVFLTRCGDKLNFGANLITTPSVESKLTFWKNSTGPRPISVIIIGLRSMSRSSAYRTLPNSVKFLTEEMGFSDFRGYHSVGPSSVSNLLGFLAGKPAGGVSDWNEVPHIWTNYSQRNYVTQYAEDRGQAEVGTFNKAPTDYYVRNLVEAVMGLRRREVSEVNCTSSHTIPDFLLLYTKQFLGKFLKVPTFSFTLFHNPPPDLSLLTFLQSLKSQPIILDDSLVVFLSDHGSLEIRSSFTLFAERGLPALFIRLPNRLNAESQYILNLNAARLTSPLDLHQTFLHVLSPLTSSRLDRTSLLLPVPLNRTCSAINIPPTSCVCNIMTMTPPDPSQNPYLGHRLLQFLTRRLNEGLDRKVCAVWTHDEDGLVSAKVSGGAEVLVQARLLPGGAQFEAKVRMSAQKIELISKQIQRLGPAGNGTQCVEPKAQPYCSCLAAQETSKRAAGKRKRHGRRGRNRS